MKIYEHKGEKFTIERHGDHRDMNGRPFWHIKIGLDKYHHYARDEEEAVIYAKRHINSYKN